MPSHGATKNMAMMEAPKPAKAAKNLDHIRLEEAENGGVIASHHFESMEHSPEPHVFGADEGAGLAAHLGEHLNHPGLAALGKAEEGGDEDRPEKAE